MRRQEEQEEKNRKGEGGRERERERAAMSKIGPSKKQFDARLKLS